MRVLIYFDWNTTLVLIFEANLERVKVGHLIVNRNEYFYSTHHWTPHFNIFRPIHLGCLRPRSTLLSSRFVFRGLCFSPKMFNFKGSQAQID